METEEVWKHHHVKKKKKSARNVVKEVCFGYDEMRLYLNILWIWNAKSM